LNFNQLLCCVLQSIDIVSRKGRLLANPLYRLQDPEMMSVEGWLNVGYRWFSLHAAVSIEGTNRSGLRQLFHYGARSSVNLSFLSYVTPDDPDRSSPRDLCSKKILDK
jgi:hypothetical protein